MDAIFLVYDVSYYKGVNRCVATPCTTLEIAKRVVKEKLDWYCNSTIIREFVNNLDNNDIWEVNDNSVKINIFRKNIQLDLYIVMGKLLSK